MGRTPLHQVCCNGNYEIADFLVHRPEIFLDVEDEDRNTPLHLAALNGHIKIVKLLIEQCSLDANCLNYESKRPIDMSSSQTIKEVRLYNNMLQFLSDFTDASIKKEKRVTMMKK